MPNILIAEDERPIADLIRMTLKGAGYRCDWAPDGDRAADLAGAGIYDLALVDVMLPGSDGFALLEYCQTLDLPVIFVTARGAVADRVRGLHAGAEDYIVKPFGVPELLARIRTTLRRADRLKLSRGSQKDIYHIKDLTVDIAKHQVLLDGEEIHFTQNEFKILELLCIHAGKVLTYDFIQEHVWGPYGSSSNQILRVNMANIRRKLKENPSEPKYVLTELGIGYRMLED